VLPPEGGFSRAQITTEHYSCYYERYDPQEIGPLLEQACSAWCEFFEVKLPLKQKFTVRMYGTAERYVAGGKKFGHWAPTFGPNMGNYCPTSRIASAYATSDVGAMRYEMVHECTHQFHYIVMTGNRGPTDKPWYREGLATWSGNGSWDGETYIMGGGKSLPLGVRPRTLEGITSGGYESYSTFFCFLMTQYPRHFQKLRQSFDRRTNESQAWLSAFGFSELPKEFVDEFDAWALAQGRLPKWTSWDEYVLARGISAALNLGTWAIGLEKVASVARLRTYLATEAYGDPIDVVVLGRDVQKVQADLAQVQQSAARRCSSELTDAYNEVVRIVRTKKAAH
jgi:hypothetical protein